MRLPGLMSLAGALALAFALLAPAGSQAGTKEILMEDNFFNPASVRIRAGSSVHWTRAPGASNPHNVRQEQLIFRSGDPTSGPIDFTIIFSSGTYYYFCEVYGSLGGGMGGFIRVKPRILEAPRGLKFTVEWATEDVDTGETYFVQYRVGASPDWLNWRSGTTTLRGVFGKNGVPVPVEDGVKYHFRVISQFGGSLSAWSPVASFTP